MKLRKIVNKKMCETNKFVRIVTIGQTKCIHAILGFITSLEIVIKTVRRQFFCPLWIFRVKYQYSTIVMKIFYAK